MGGILVRNVFLWIAVAAVGAALWGCGGGDSSSSTTAASNGSGAATGNGSTTTTGNGGGASDQGGATSKAEFVDRANAICKAGKKKGLKEMAAYVQAHASSSGRKLTQLGEALQAVFLPEVQNQVDGIRALGAPPGDEKQIEAFLDSLEEGVKTSSQASAASGLQLGPNFNRSAQLAREYGLKACAYG